MSLKINKKGFSIGEVMLAVFIVASVLTIVSGLMGKTLKTFFEDRDGVIAANLSQEGIELVRNIRDNDFVSEKEFGDGLGSTPGPENYIIQRGGQLADASSGSEALKYSDSEGYNHSSGSKTDFNRRIIISGDGDEREVVSMVTWNGNPFDFPSEEECTFVHQCVLTKAILTNWNL